MIRSGVVATSAEHDFTAKVDVRDLDPGASYYYRFLSRSVTSATGQTRTLPTGRLDSLRMAVFSCSNYPAGYFHAYGEASRLPDVDVFVHLGDYFYEYGAGGYATERAAELGRELPADNAGELFTLTDYRRRYALYRTDADLQAMHARAAMIAVWDDHEIANDTWREGAQNHGPDEGDFDQRKAAAVQAYFEWLPLRPIRPHAQGRIYRSFDFGDLLSLHMLDTRLIGRDQQLEFSHFVDEETGDMDSEAFREALSTDRSLLGTTQREWLSEKLAASPAHWQVLGQQILMARMHMPASMLSSLFAERDFANAEALIDELARDKAALLAGEELPVERQRRIAQALPYNLDAWDGYPVERERLYAVARELGKELIVLAGDTHNAWHSTLHDRSGNTVGVEFATPGVSSPGMESYLSLDNEAAQALERALTVLIDELEYCQLYNRGFLDVRFSRDEIQARWHFVDDVTRRDYSMTVKELTVTAA